MEANKIGLKNNSKITEGHGFKEIWKLENIVINCKLYIQIKFNLPLMCTAEEIFC